jgi:multiple sugar transport system permease protein
MAKKGHNKHKLKKQLEWYSFIIIPLVTLLVLVYVPMLSTIRYSLYDVSFLGYGEKYVGLRNYRMLLTSSSFLRAFGNTVVLTLMGLLTIPLGFILASFINSLGKGRLQGFFRVGFYLPNIITGVSVILMFQVILKGNDGLFNGFLSLVTGHEISVGWLSDSHYAKFGATLLWIWMNLGYSMLINLASMQSIQTEIYEAAAVDGANAFKRWVYITIPHMKQCFAFLFVTSMISGLSRFTDLFVIGGNSSSGAPGGTLQTLLLYIYQYSFEVPQYGISSAGAMILFVIVLLFTLINVKMSGMFREEK